MSRCKFFIDNWRWSGVPFYLRTGKNLPAERERSAHSIPPDAACSVCRAMRHQAGCQCHHAAAAAQRRHLRCDSTARFPAPACSCVPCECISATTPNSAPTRRKLMSGCCSKRWPATPRLFIRRDEVETAWRIVDPIREGWSSEALDERSSIRREPGGPTQLKNYSQARPQLAEPPADRMTKVALTYFKGAQELAQAAANRWCRRIAEAKGPFTVAVSGGRIANEFFRQVAAEAAQNDGIRQAHFFGRTNGVCRRTMPIAIIVSRANSSWNHCRSNRRTFIVFGVKTIPRRPQRRRLRNSCEWPAARWGQRALPTTAR